MSLGSLLAGSEPLLQPGQEAVVGVAVATLWTAPDRLRPIDEPAITVLSRSLFVRYAASMRGLTVSARKRT